MKGGGEWRYRSSLRGTGVLKVNWLHVQSWLFVCSGSAEDDDDVHIQCRGWPLKPMSATGE